MVEALPSSDLFSRSGPPERRKVLVLGSSEKLSETVSEHLRSLHVEHVSPATMMRREISRSGSKPPKGQESLLVALRHWFWSRKPDAGFLLTDFPATLLQAQVLDEWLDARSEALDAVFAGATAPQTLIHYYRIHGLLREETDFTS